MSHWHAIHPIQRPVRVSKPKRTPLWMLKIPKDSLILEFCSRVQRLSALAALALSSTTLFNLFLVPTVLTFHALSFFHSPGFDLSTLHTRASSTDSLSVLDVWQWTGSPGQQVGCRVGTGYDCRG